MSFRRISASFLFVFIVASSSTKLESTDAAPEEPHPRRTRWDAATREGRRRPRVRATSGRVLPHGAPDSRRLRRLTFGATATRFPERRYRSGRRAAHQIENGTRFRRRSGTRFGEMVVVL
nr:hypothetical protein CFP56_26616 [Quercus suber]